MEPAGATRCKRMGTAFHGRNPAVLLPSGAHYQLDQCTSHPTKVVGQQFAGPESLGETIPLQRVG